MRTAIEASIAALLITVSPLACSSALAQTTSSPPQPEPATGANVKTPTANEVTQPGTTAAPDPTGLEQIIVTAQRRSEKAQDVPISLQAFSGQNLKNAVVRRTEDLTNLVGGFIVQPSAARPALFIRGVGTNSSNTTPAVLTFIDGVYQPFGQSVDLENVSSIEVLKGPQGTLFGRNATGGVIQITTRAPTAQLGGHIEAGYGNYNTFQGSGYVTGGIAKGVAADLSVRYIHQGDGFGTNIFNGEDVFFNRRFSARSRVRFDLSDVTSITLAADYTKLRGTVGANVSPADGYEFLFVNGALRTRGSAFYPGDYDVNANLQPGWRSKEWGTSLNFETKFSDLTFRSITAYRHNAEHIRIDFDGGPANTTNLGIDRDPRKGVTQEFQLLSSAQSKLQWVVGAFYYHSDWASDPFQICTNTNLFTTPCGPIAIANDTTRSIAAYAQGTYEILPSTRLTLGGRYTSEKRTTEGHVVIAGNTIAARTGSLSLRTNEPSWRVALDHKFTPDIMVYAAVSHSFNSGFFNQSNFAGFANEIQNPPVQPELLTVYEAGAKTDLFDRHLRFNLSGYIYDYSNLQQQIYDQGAVKTINAGSAKIKGIDFEITARPIQNFTLSWTGTYLDAYYTSYPLAPLYVLQPNGSILAVGNSDAAGNTIVNAPRWSWTASASYMLPTTIGRFTTSGNLNYRGRTFVDPANSFKLPTRFLMNASERWTSSSGRYYGELWVQNLFDRKYDYAINILTPVGLVGNRAPPRTYGATVGVEF